MQDHHFDVVTNVVGLVAAVLGDKFYWWIDPVGAILLALYTIANWSHTVMENAGNASIISLSELHIAKCWNLQVCPLDKAIKWAFAAKSSVFVEKLG